MDYLLIFIEKNNINCNLNFNKQIIYKYNIKYI